MHKSIFSLTLLLLSAFSYSQITIERNTALHLDEGASLVAEGDADIQVSITGNGSLILAGTSLQRINSHGFAIPNLVINNTACVDLSGAVSVTRSLTMQNGTLRCVNNELTLESNATIDRTNRDAWIETNGSGRVWKMIDGEISGYLVPLGSKDGYFPLYLTASGSQNALIGVRSARGVSGEVQPVVSDYLNNTWTISLSDIQNAVKVLAFYPGGSAVKGSEREIQAFYRSSARWKATPAELDTKNNVIHVSVSGTGGEVFAVKAPNSPFGETGRTGMMPNPAGNYSMLTFNSTVNEKKEVIITDETGRPARKQIIPATMGCNQHRINLVGLPSGYYHIRVTGLDKTFSIVKR